MYYVHVVRRTVWMAVRTHQNVSHETPRIRKNNKHKQKLEIRYWFNCLICAWHIEWDELERLIDIRGTEKGMEKEKWNFKERVRKRLDDGYIYSRQCEKNWYRRQYPETLLVAYDDIFVTQPRFYWLHTVKNLVKLYNNLQKINQWDIGIFIIYIDIKSFWLCHKMSYLLALYRCQQKWIWKPWLDLKS